MMGRRNACRRACRLYRRAARREPSAPTPGWRRHSCRCKPDRLWRGRGGAVVHWQADAEEGAHPGPPWKTKKLRWLQLPEQLARGTRGRECGWARENPPARNFRLGFAEIQRTLQNNFELQILFQGQVLADSGCGHEGLRRAGCGTFGSFFFIVVDDAGLRAGEGRHGHSQSFLLMVAGGGFDFAFAVEQDVDGVNARSVDDSSHQRSPAGAGVNVVKRDPKMSAT